MWTFAAANSMLRGDGPPPGILLLPLLMAVLGLFIMKSLVLDLVDSVWTQGCILVSRNSKELKQDWPDIRIPYRI